MAVARKSIVPSALTLTGVGSPVAEIVIETFAVFASSVDVTARSKVARSREPEVGRGVDALDVGGAGGALTVGRDELLPHAAVPGTAAHMIMTVIMSVRPFRIPTLRHVHGIA
jgi:hypothetical protein